MSNQEQFSGDMSRNEVEIDLNKFMAMVSEIGELKAKIMELENDKEPDNPWQKWIWLFKCLYYIVIQMHNMVYGSSSTNI